MIDPRENIDTFINNAGKSTEKPVIEYNAYTGEQGKAKHELDVTRGDVFIVIAAACIIGFVTLLHLGELT